MQRFLKAPALFLFGTFIATPATANTIDFEGFVAGTNITNQIPGVVFSAIGGINQTWIFDTNNPTGGDSDLAAPFDEIFGFANNHNPGNVLIIQENVGPGPDDLAGGGIIDVVFDTITTLFSIDFFDMEENTQVFLFDSGGIPIGVPFSTDDSDTANDVMPNLYEHLVFNGPSGVTGVKSMRIIMTGSGAIDSIVHSVPLPATVWLMGVAMLGLIGLNYRQQRK